MSDLQDRVRTLAVTEHEKTHAEAANIVVREVHGQAQIVWSAKHTSHILKTQTGYIVIDEEDKCLDWMEPVLLPDLIAVLAYLFR